MDITLSTPLNAVLTNRRRVGALRRLGFTTIGELLQNYPRKVLEPAPYVELANIRPSSTPIVSAGVISSTQILGGYSSSARLVIVVTDDLGHEVTLTFFGKQQYLQWNSKRFSVGGEIVWKGTISQFQSTLQAVHPDVLFVGSDCVSVEAGIEQYEQAVPVYHATSSISSEHISETIQYVLSLLKTSDMPDIIPEHIRKQYNYMHRYDAVRAIHEPEDIAHYQSALKTLQYEEMLIAQTAMMSQKMDYQHLHAYSCGDSVADNNMTAELHADDWCGSGELVRDFIESLPFELTQGQKDAIHDIISDMNRDFPMNRLLEGEVGSGKTIVALAGLLHAVEAGYQGLIVAPTQVLAQQHCDTIVELLRRLEQYRADCNREPVTQSHDDHALFEAVQQAAGEHNPIVRTAICPVMLLSGNLNTAQRAAIYGYATSGMPCIIVATHAAFQQEFTPTKLALAIIDEQHRFGVEQRNSLRTTDSAHAADNIQPHVLSMTATPIPRSVAMTWFGDLDISVLATMPSGRKPVRTHVIGEQNVNQMQALFVHLRQRIDHGERVYVVCPRIEAMDTAVGSSDDFGDNNDRRTPLRSVEDIAERLSRLQQLQGVSIATLTGQNTEEEKNDIMRRFTKGDIALLVATTVIEVGVNVPEASSIVIFDADRFGLSQLHQLRGRVGRGGNSAWCFLITRLDVNSESVTRLQLLERTHDGLTLAEADMELRGVGDVLGTLQSGHSSSLKLVNVLYDREVISQARNDAETILHADPALEQPQYVQLHGAVLDFLRGNESALLQA